MQHKYAYLNIYAHIILSLGCGGGYGYGGFRGLGMEILRGFRAGFSVPSVCIRMGMWIEIESHSALKVLDDYCAIKIDLLTYLLTYLLTCFQTNSETPTALSLHSESH